MLNTCIVVTTSKTRALMCCPWARHAIHSSPGAWRVFRSSKDYAAYIHANAINPIPKKRHGQKQQAVLQLSK